MPITTEGDRILLPEEEPLQQGKKHDLKNHKLKSKQFRYVDSKIKLEPHNKDLQKINQILEKKKKIQES